MKAWSDSPIHPNFTVKFFVDTNILVYLVDDTYASLTDFIHLSKDSKFIELVSSKYVIFEFVGVRKREHYLRKVANASKKSDKGEINFSSLLNLRNINSFDTPGVDFVTVIPDIKRDVEEELQKIATDYKIYFDYSTIHGDQLTPTFEVCLSTKISNQDSLVLISAVLPQPKTYMDGLQLLTNDGEFVKFFDEANIDHVFSTFNIEKPVVSAIDKINSQGNTKINLKETINKEDLEGHLKDKIVRLIKEKNKSFFIGTTFTPTGAGFPNDAICFKFNLNQEVPRDIYITVLGKNLDFIYTSKKKTSALLHSGEELEAGHIFTNGAKNKVSYKLVDVDAQGNEVAISADIVNAIRTEGNLVFVHPDSTTTK